jgi:hypothetical protein
MNYDFFFFSVGLIYQHIFLFAVGWIYQHVILFAMGWIYQHVFFSRIYQLDVPNFLMLIDKYCALARGYSTSRKIKAHTALIPQIIQKSPS